MKEKQVQISEELFFCLLKYFIASPEDRTNTEEQYILKELELKINRMIDHDLYSKYKSAPTEEQREQARQEYLNRKGILESFRW